MTEKLIRLYYIRHYSLMLNADRIENDTYDVVWQRSLRRPAM